MECTESRFLEDVKNHQMIIIRNDGLNRHIRFKRPDTICYYFDLITWKGHLCITGDCGTYVFTRIEDMFAFFRTDKYEKIYPDKKLFINPDYWSGKLVAVDKVDGYKKFSPDIFEDRIKEYFNEWEFNNDDQKKEVWEEIENNVLCYCEDSEYTAYNAAINYKSDYGHEFSDFWEVDCGEWTFRFLWNCYAIVWGISVFDKLQDKNKAEKPIHPDIEKYGYFLMYSKSTNNWYAAYDEDSKGAAWYKWNGNDFDLISRTELPKDLN